MKIFILFIKLNFLCIPLCFSQKEYDFNNLETEEIVKVFGYQRRDSSTIEFFNKWLNVFLDKEEETNIFFPALGFDSIDYKISINHFDESQVEQINLSSIINGSSDEFEQLRNKVFNSYQDGEIHAIYSLRHNYGKRWLTVFENGEYKQIEVDKIDFDSLINKNTLIFQLYGYKSHYTLKKSRYTSVFLTSNFPDFNIVRGIEKLKLPKIKFTQKDTFVDYSFLENDAENLKSLENLYFNKLEIDTDFNINSLSDVDYFYFFGDSKKFPVQFCFEDRNIPWIRRASRKYRLKFVNNCSWEK